jgi:cation transporter-like permease
MSAIIFCSNAYILSLISIVRVSSGECHSCGYISSFQREEASSFIRVLTFIIPMVLELFIPLYFGNDLSIASSRLSTALFHSDWSKATKKTKQMMKMFMINTKKDLKISAFGLFNSDLATFTSVLNFAYSLFAVLKRMNEK